MAHTFRQWRMLGEAYQFWHNKEEGTTVNIEGVSVSYSVQAIAEALNIPNEGAKVAHLSTRSDAETRKLWLKRAYGKEDKGYNELTLEERIYFQIDITCSPRKD